MRPTTARETALGLICFLSAGILFALGINGAYLERLSNYPNPFDSRRESTVITYMLPQDAAVRVRIYDLFGIPVREFQFSPGENGGRSGENRFNWDGTDETGEKVSKGGYLCQVIVEGDQPVRGIRKIGVVH